jgi:hypothetical protein
MGASLHACVGGPIIWEDPTYFPRDLAATIGLGESPQRCGTAETALGPIRFRAGWGSNGGALTVMRSGDGGASWDAPVIVDARTSSVACPQLAVFADTINRYLHVGYFLDTRSDAGLYYAHSMNADRLAATGEGMFETPRAIIYGDRPVAISIASRGDTVAVVHEDPNSQQSRIMVALSTTAGHSFDHREQVSQQAGEAVRPSVELRVGEIHVAWTQVARATARPVRRVGRFR